MQDRIKEYLAKADWCEEQAETDTNPDVSRFYVTLARAWRAFATGPLARHASSSAVEFLPTLKDAQLG
jgi:hypothetical protein